MQGVAWNCFFAYVRIIGSLLSKERPVVNFCFSCCFFLLFFLFFSLSFVIFMSNFLKEETQAFLFFCSLKIPNAGVRFLFSLFFSVFKEKEEKTKTKEEKNIQY